MIRRRNLILTATGDVGGQKTLRSYWKNYFEKTDTLVWVVDATDRLRVDDCRQELSGLLLEEVRTVPPPAKSPQLTTSQRLMGASLLVFLNKTDVEHCMSEHEVRQVWDFLEAFSHVSRLVVDLTDFYSALTWIQSKRTNGRFSHAVP